MPNGDERKTEQLVQEAAKNIDPFSQAREKANQPVLETAQEFDPFANPFEIQNVPFEVQGIDPQKAQEPVTIERLFSSQPKPKETNLDRFSRSLEEAGLAELGLGLPLTTMGKVQFMSRLREKFGNNFLANPQARRALQAFEKEIDKEEDEDQAAKLNRQGQRTISALLGGADES